MTSWSNSIKFVETIKFEVKKRGYHFQYFLLNSVNFGLPQNRVRVFMIGILEENIKLNLVSDLGPKDSHSYTTQQLSLFNQNQIFKTVKDILEDNPDPCFDCSTNFVKALAKVVNNDFSKLHGVRLIDYRGGNSIHSWELGLRGECTPDEIQLMNLFIKERRRKKFGTHQDGKLLTAAQIATFFDRPKLPAILQSLVNKRYLQIIDNCYKPVSGNFSFEVYKFLDPHKVSVTIVASDANRIGVYHNNRVRRITPREAARLQGFPDYFCLHQNTEKAFFQLGNSVSINVVEAVAEEVIQKVYESSKYLTQNKIISNPVKISS